MINGFSDTDLQYRHKRHNSIALFVRYISFVAALDFKDILFA